MTQDKPRIFETQNADLASFLMMEGVKLLGIRRSETNSKIAILTFSDDHQNCLDLQQVYLNSNFKKFRDINKHILQEVFKALRV